MLGLSHPSHVLGTWEPLRRDTDACAEHRTPSCPAESPGTTCSPTHLPSRSCSGLGAKARQTRCSH